jgi:hypothetical protein
MCDSSAVHYPSVFHSASDDASEFADSTSQASSPSDDTVDSVWQLLVKRSPHAVVSQPQNLVVTNARMTRCLLTLIVWCQKI